MSTLRSRFLGSPEVWICACPGHSLSAIVDSVVIPRFLGIPEGWVNGALALVIAPAPVVIPWPISTVLEFHSNRQFGALRKGRF